MTPAEQFDVHGSVENPDADKGFACSPGQHLAECTDGLSVTQLLKAFGRVYPVFVPRDDSTSACVQPLAVATENHYEDVARNE